MKFISITFLSLLFTTAIHAQRDKDHVSKMISDSLKANPKNSNWLFLQAIAFNETNNLDSAVNSLSLSLKYLHQFKIDYPNAMTIPNDKPLDSMDILHMRANCYDRLDSLQLSINDYRYLQSRKPNDLFYSIAVLRLYMKRKQFVNAQLEIENIKKVKGNEERALVQQAILFYESEKYQEGLEAADTALEAYPSSIEGLITKAKILIKLNRLTEACKYFDEASSKMAPEYFGGERGYQRDFENDIKRFKIATCR